MDRVWETFDCPTCAGSGFILSGPRHGYCDDCNATGEVRRVVKVNDLQEEEDRKYVAYTTVGDMSPEAFNLLIEGDWRRPRARLVERGGVILEYNRPLNELEWEPGSVDPYAFARSQARIRRKEEEMSGDISHDGTDYISHDRGSDYISHNVRLNPSTQSAYQKAMKYREDRGGWGLTPTMVPKKGIAGQVGDIIIQCGRVFRAYVRTKI